MNPIAIVFLLVCAVCELKVSRRWASVPLLVGCCYMTIGQGVELGPFNFPIYRMLLAVGVLRVIIRGERLFGPLNTIDKMVIVWAVWVLFASLFHEFKPGSGPIYTGGVIYNVLLFYFLARIWCQNLDDISNVVQVVAILLVPIAVEMLLEKATGRNMFAVFGAVLENALVREGRIRAQGPFLHPILAGTVGATCIPLFLGILGSSRKVAIIGILSAFVIVFSSSSSGPVMSLLFGLGAVAMWRLRHLTRMARWTAVGAYVALMIFMTRPPYYLIAKIDISGGSTGWHRSFLIEQTFKHFSEWWLFGTDRTRHWMPNQGIASDPNNTDITNYYIGHAVMGGIAAMVLIIAMMLVCFRWVGVFVRASQDENPSASFMIWCFGAGLFAHAATGISVAYFDQSMIFLWLNIAVVSSVYTAAKQWHDDVMGLALSGDEHRIKLPEDPDGSSSARC